MADPQGWTARGSIQSLRQSMAVSQQRDNKALMATFSSLSEVEKQNLFLLDKQLIQYQLGLNQPEKLGSGSFGRVYRAKDGQGTYVAIKVQNYADYNQQEYAAAESLEEATNRNLMPKASILTIIAHDLLEFLAYFHEKGLVHCDIKPANIIFQSLDDGFIPKMCDFGETTALQLQIYSYYI
ncbi:MAG: hypothetical protein EZS28_036086 [Streblomastix strix]|uniref:Protein kinase domain-containing protein n=1 Tax=Streblomastix strix TaxID=222440 RepID=A0A5J4UCY0_9EUKA|nr:MAG: hypothetical protein EZS28_036086 [Streblomastix strix]